MNVLAIGCLCVSYTFNPPALQVQVKQTLVAWWNHIRLIIWRQIIRIDQSSA